MCIRDRALRANTNEKAEIKYKRNNVEATAFVAPFIADSINVYGEKIKAPQIGVDFQPFYPTVGIINTESVAAHAGLKTSDHITHVDGQAVKYWWQVEEAFEKQFQKKDAVTLKVKRYNTDQIDLEKFSNHDIVLSGQYLSPSQAGFEFGELYIRKVLPNSVAQKAGILAGDKILKLNDTKIDTWFNFHESIQLSLIHISEPTRPY